MPNKMAEYIKIHVICLSQCLCREQATQYTHDGAGESTLDGAREDKSARFFSVPHSHRVYSIDEDSGYVLVGVPVSDRADVFERRSCT